LGVGDIRDGEIYVEKMVFPTQIVNGAHVHFKPSDWAEIIKELTMEEMSRICFYWHKHPDNMPGCSQGDEDDTFDVFMDPSAGRRVFGFLQTANSSTGIKYEARIEMRKPIWASITDVQIYTDADSQIETECLKIIEDKITTGYASASSQPGIAGEFKELSPLVTTDSEEEEPYMDMTMNAYKEEGWVKIAYCFVMDAVVEHMIADVMVKDLWDTMKIDTIKDGRWVTALKPKKKCTKKLLKELKTLIVDKGAAFDEEFGIKLPGSIDDAVAGQVVAASKAGMIDKHSCWDYEW